MNLDEFVHFFQNPRVFTAFRESFYDLDNIAEVHPNRDHLLFGVGQKRLWFGGRILVFVQIRLLFFRVVHFLRSPHLQNVRNQGGVEPNIFHVLAAIDIHTGIDRIIFQHRKVLVQTFTDDKKQFRIDHVFRGLLSSNFQQLALFFLYFFRTGLFLRRFGQADDR